MWVLGVSLKSNNPRNLKFKYGMFGLFFVWCCIAISAFPIWQYSQWLSQILEIESELSVKEQANGKIWLMWFCIGLTSIFVVTYAVLGALFSRIMGFSKQQYVGIFFKNRYPNWWYK